MSPVDMEPITRAIPLFAVVGAVIAAGWWTEARDNERLSVTVDRHANTIRTLRNVTLSDEQCDRPIGQVRILPPAPYDWATCAEPLT
jgi:hypothetical protein